MPSVLSRSFLGAITCSITNALKTFVILFIHLGGPKSCKCCIAAILTLGDVSDIQRDYPDAQVKRWRLRCLDYL
jgi:hypothetical protein